MGVEGRCVQPQPGGSRRVRDARSWRSSPGFVLVAFSLALLLILGAVGLSFDIGRMYVTRSESQTFVDSAAIAAALKLNGTAGGLQAARDAAAATVKRWQFGNTAFPFNPATDVTFATTLMTPLPWPANPVPATGYVCARVTTRVSLPIFLLPALVGATHSSIAASAVAKQIEVTAPGPGHYGPFSPYGAPNMNPDPDFLKTRNLNDPFNMFGAETRANNAWTGGYNNWSGYAYPSGYTSAGGGKLYNILWPNNPQVEAHSKDDQIVCPGNQFSSLISIKTTDDKIFGVNNSNRGYIYNESSIVAETIITGLVPTSYDPLATGDTLLDGYLDDAGGAMHHNIASGLADRANTDSDPDTMSYVEYMQLGKGNGQRVMVMPIDSGPCGTTTFTPKKGGLDPYAGTNTCVFPVGDGTTATRPPNGPPTPPIVSYEVVGWGRFFLRPYHYYKTLGGSDGACAEYIGPGDVEGGGAGGAGVYVVKLVK